MSKFCGKGKKRKVSGWADSPDGKSKWTDLAFRVAFRLGEQDEVFEEENVSESLLAALPAVKFVLAEEPTLFLDVDVAVAQRVHGQQIVAVTQLEADHLLGGHQIGKFRLLIAALLEQLFEEQRVFAHPLDRLKEVAGQVHLIAQFRLFPLLKRPKFRGKNRTIRVVRHTTARRRKKAAPYPEECGSVLGHEGVGLGLVLVVEGVEVEVLLVPEETLADQEGRVLATLQFAQEVVMVEAVDLFDVSEDDVALASQRLRDVLA